jgi:uncharacterized protein (DUF924 family)
MTEASEGDWTDEVLGFWFALDPEQWWTPDAELDDEILERFHDLWCEQRPLPASSFLEDAHTALAATILFDQFPRNMFRAAADQFATDPLALAIAKGAVHAGFDKQLDEQRRAFLYMPFMHSENLDDQQRSMLLFTSLGDEEKLHFARKHHEVIERFGRFPHRNKLLGRIPRPEEAELGDEPPW